MVDIHTHIIFGIDDGARDFEETKTMIKMASESGTTHMVATSHYEHEAYPYDMDVYFTHLKMIQEWCESEKINMTVVPGNEFFLDASVIKDVKNKVCNSINNSNYILVEISNFMQFNKIEEMLDLIANMDYKIVIAHVERLKWVLEDFSVIEEWYKKGYGFQVNVSSILNKKYRENYQSAHKLLRKGMIHAVASDGHRMDRRLPILSEGKEYIEKLYDNKTAELLFVSNPMNILENKDIKGLREHRFYKKHTLKNLLNRMKGAN